MEVPYVKLILAKYCMPTLLKMKPASLINVSKENIGGNIDEDTGFLHQLKGIIKCFQCDYSLLYENEISLIILVYYETSIDQILKQEDNRRFLINRGYHLGGERLGDTGNIENILGQLKKKYGVYKNRDITEKGEEQPPLLNGCYPHEIGLLLGFPLEDVEDFIRHEGKDYLYCGAWKVYHNPGAALRIFESYRKVRDHTLQLLLEGTDIEDICEAGSLQALVHHSGIKLSGLIFPGR